MENSEIKSVKVHLYNKELPAGEFNYYEQENGLKFALPSWVLAHWYCQNMILQTLSPSGRRTYQLSQILQAIEKETDPFILSKIIYYGDNIK